MSPNADRAIQIAIAHERLAKFGRPSSEDGKRSLATSWALKVIYDYYVAAAEKAGVSRADVALQLEAEYGVNPIPYLTPPTAEEVEQRKISFKRESLKMKREMLKNPEARKYIPVDENGEPIWDEKKHGEFALIVVKIDKDEGLEEFGGV